MKWQQGCFKRRVCSTADPLPLLSKENHPSRKATDSPSASFSAATAAEMMKKMELRKIVSELHRNTKVIENLMLYACVVSQTAKLFLVGLVEMLEKLYLWHLLEINSIGFIHADTQTLQYIGLLKQQQDIESPSLRSKKLAINTKFLFSFKKPVFS